jgi:hypothetical protein
VFEEWLAHGKPPLYVEQKAHALYASEPGWWVSGWQGTLAQLVELGLKPVVLRQSQAKRDSVELEPEPAPEPDE